MYYKAHEYTDEFWGRKITDYEYELFEDYEGEVFDIIKGKIKYDGWDNIPSEIDILADGEFGEKYFTINPYDYLTDEQINKLESFIKQYYEEE